MVCLEFGCFDPSFLGLVFFFANIKGKAAGGERTFWCVAVCAEMCVCCAVVGCFRIFIFFTSVATLQSSLYEDMPSESF